MRTTVPAIVQARMSSSRAPGKMLRVVEGRPLLQYVIDRLRHCPAIQDIVVATSRDASDDPIAAFCSAAALPCHRGPLEDVAGRFLAVIADRRDPLFARVCGDRPLLDTTLLERAVALIDPDVDLVTNTHPRTFPTGQAVEIVRTAAFAAAYPRMDEPEDREHVTRFFYRHAGEFRIRNFSSDLAAADVHLAVDTEEDVRRFETIVRRMTRPHWTYGLSEIVRFYRDVAA